MGQNRALTRSDCHLPRPSLATLGHREDQYVATRTTIRTPGHRGSIGVVPAMLDDDLKAQQVRGRSLPHHPDNMSPSIAT